MTSINSQIYMTMPKQAPKRLSENTGTTFSVIMPPFSSRGGHNYGNYCTVKFTFKISIVLQLNDPTSKNVFFLIILRLPYDIKHFFEVIQSHGPQYEPHISISLLGNVFYKRKNQIFPFSFIFCLV